MKQKYDEDDFHESDFHEDDFDTKIMKQKDDYIILTFIILSILFSILSFYFFILEGRLIFFPCMVFGIVCTSKLIRIYKS